ncbi:hypothetical protein GCM10010275_20030 [Streptomyces litmocidini]|uniref:hypothetical protein n=1 Tax=Streptomyces litmocidini TaxID=67318 RepID=UPI0019918D4D|nr:hypothetical protein [Streptomyces litmocidini]GGU84883.1 hypothetical protein GCM10010275_20030 [Streptomyces litmocidini]
MGKLTSGRWFAAALAASAVLTAGCTAQVDAEDLPGLYRNEQTGGEIRLDSDGTFTATDLSTGEHTDPADFHGKWDFVDNGTLSYDFVYLDIDGRGIGEVSGVHLYARGGGKIAFSTPNGSWSLVLTKSAEK